jgi:hypothetical protein
MSAWSIGKGSGTPRARRLGKRHEKFRWSDRDGDVWAYNPNTPSWECNGDKVISAGIWSTVPAVFGPFTKLE